MFISSKLAVHMRWHKNRRRDDGEDDDIMRHPSDSEAWKSLDNRFPDFVVDVRNVRLGLVTDGFNPGGMSCRYSIWPVMVVPYNLPPWMCMKNDNIILSLLIPGPKAPGNDIDIFLQPLIDELKELWDIGVKTFDAHTKETFNMRAVLLWTINDFPAYANLSGWSTKGNIACPCCHKDTESKRLSHGRKWCYMGHRKFLKPDHKWKLNRSCSFGGKVERGPPPDPLTGYDVLEQLSGYSNMEFGENNKGKRKKGERCNACGKNVCESEIEKHGEDTLNVQDAYIKVLKHKSGYVRGLGLGARPQKKGGIEGESNETRVELSSEIQHLKDVDALRESQIDTLKASNDELKASNEELKAFVSKST